MLTYRWFVPPAPPVNDHARLHPARWSGGKHVVRDMDPRGQGARRRCDRRPPLQGGDRRRSNAHFEAFAGGGVAQFRPDGGVVAVQRRHCRACRLHDPARRYHPRPDDIRGAVGSPGAEYGGFRVRGPRQRVGPGRGEWRAHRGVAPRGRHQHGRAAGGASSPGAGAVDSQPRGAVLHRRRRVGAVRRGAVPAAHRQRV